MRALTLSIALALTLTVCRAAAPETSLSAADVEMARDYPLLVVPEGEAETNATPPLPSEWECLEATV